MIENIDLKDLEKKAYKSTFEDGIWDIFIGMIFLAFGLLPLGELLGLPELVGMFLVSIFWNAGAVVVMFLGKKYITVPRIGIIKFGPKRMADQRKLKIFLSLNVLLGVVVMLVQMSGIFKLLNIRGSALSLLLGVFISFPFGVVAYYMDFPRLYIYAVLGGVGFFLTDISDLFIGSPFSLIITFGLIGGSILVTGFVFLIKFVRKYPLPEKLS